MDVREKLAELLQVDLSGSDGYEPELIADYMLDHGVTVQEWISVDDRLPEPKEKSICIDADGNIIIGTYTEWGWVFPCYCKRPTHWMPLPVPPKGE